MDWNVHFCTICEITFLVGGPWKVFKKWLQCKMTIFDTCI